MSSILLIGLIGALFIIFFKTPIIGIIGDNNKPVKKLKNAKWFQKPLSAGMFLFTLNAVLFSFACLLLYILTYFQIPYLHLIVMLFAVVTSVFCWIVVNQAWQGSKKSRLKFGLIGSSFYLLLTIIFIFRFATSEPAYRNEDTFMSAIGLIFIIIITAIAFTTSLVFTGFSKKPMNVK